MRLHGLFTDISVTPGAAGIREDNENMTLDEMQVSGFSAVAVGRQRRDFGGATWMAFPVALEVRP
jgi:hypothetical protein